MTIVAASLFGCGSSGSSSSPSTRAAASVPAALKTSFTLGLGADAVQREAMRQVRSVKDPGVFDLLVRATCKPPSSPHGPYGNPQLRCHAALLGRLLGVDTPIAPRHDFDEESWVVDIRPSGKIVGAASATPGLGGSKFVTDLQLDVRYGCIKASVVDPANAPPACVQ